MKQNLSINQRLAQTMTVTPQMIQALKIMQYSTPELLEHINHEISDNPFLVENARGETGLSSAETQTIDNFKQKLEYIDTPAARTPAARTFQDGSNDKNLIIERTASREKNLSEILLQQLGFVYDKELPQYRIGEYIIGSLDEDGYLKENAEEEIITELEIDKEDFKEVLSKIRDFEPEGIASRNIQECLLKQLDNLDSYDLDLEREIITGHFDLLMKRKKAEIIRALERSAEDVERAMHTISMLEPKPARKYSSLENNYVIPDILVKKVGDENQLLINDDVIPDISFNDEYKKFLKIKDNPELKKYLLEKEDKAVNLLNSIKYRKSNLVKVMHKLLEVQKEFFDKGPGYLVPYTLMKLSEDININPGTLSRIVNSKFLQSEWGVFSLRIFFSSSVKSVSGDVSSNNIKNMIKEIIENWDGSKKLSDQKIVEVLAKKGIKVARRTVAKYRNNLNILSSFHR